MLPIGRNSINKKDGSGDEIDVLIVANKKTKRRGFSLVYNESLTEIAKRKLAGLDLSVLLTMVANMNFDNVCEMSQTQIAEELDTARDVISRSIKRLEGYEYIAMARKIGTVKYYQVSPYVGTKCDSKHQKKLVDEWNAKFEGNKVTPIRKPKKSSNAS